MENLELSDIRSTLEGTNSILSDINKSLTKDELLAELSKQNESLERIADSLEKIVAILKLDKNIGDDAIL